MDTYMQRRLVSLHDAGSAVGFRDKFIAFLLGILLIFLLPFLHIGVFYSIWSPGKPTVDQAHCSCGCFDTVFRGRYEWPPSAYKHVYFNATPQTLKMWLFIVLGVVGLYECVRYVAPLVWQRRLRLSMFLLLLSSLYPHYYGWWGFLNYLNEDFYAQWYHQVFFSLTEVLSTALVVHLCNADSKVEPWKLLLIFSINLMHIIINSLDQFINNIIYRQGQQFEAVRDFGLMIPDLFHVLLAYFEMSALAQRRKVKFFRMFYKEELLMALVLVTLFSLLGKNL